MERKIGETFEYKGKIYKVAEMPEYFCAFCDLEKECSIKRSYLEKVTGTCSPNNRKDTRDVCFKEIKKDKQPNRWSFGYEVGDLVNAFESLQEIESLIKKLKKKFPSDEWKVEIERNY